MKTDKRIRCLVLALIEVLAAPVFAGPAASPDADAARAKAIQETIQAVDREVKEYGGGSFEKWAEALKPFRASLQAGQPRQGFTFNPSGKKLLLVDKVEQCRNGDRPFKSILNSKQQLKARGIDLIVIFIPDKVAVYPDYLADPATVPEHRMVSVAMKRFIRQLLENDVEVVDLYTPFRDARTKQLGGLGQPDKQTPLYYDKDIHWRNVAARLASDAIAERLKRYDFVQKAQAGEPPFVGKPARRTDGKADDLVQVFKRGGEPYWDVWDSPVLLTGDSYSKYNWCPAGPGQSPNPSAHFSAQVALRIGVPLMYVGTAGLWDDMLEQVSRIDLGQEPKAPGIKGILKNCRVVLYTMIGRALDAERKWEPFTLPPATP